MQPEIVTDDLLVRYASGEADAAEHAQVQQWLSKSEANRKQLADILLIFEQADNLPVPGPVNERLAWQKLQQRLAATPVKRLQFGWMKIAAVFILLAGVAVYFVFNNNKQSQPAPAAMIDIFSESGSRTDTLPDNSVVTLSGRSSLHYAAAFAGNKRDVRLEGEGFFSVTHDKTKPFVVSVKDIMVTVTGTSFTIESYGPKTTVAVHTGIVRVSRRAKEVTLQPNEMVIIAEDDTSLVKQPAVYYSPDTTLQKEAPQVDAGLANDIERQKSIMRNILRDITQDKLVPAGDSIQWFGLDWTNFMINDVAQPVAVYKKYKTKYLHLPGYGFYYGPSSMTGRGFFFSKREIEQ